MSHGIVLLNISNFLLLMFNEIERIDSVGSCPNPIAFTTCKWLVKTKTLPKPDTSDVQQTFHIHCLSSITCHLLCFKRI